MTEITVTPLVVPMTGDDEDAAEFRAMIDIGNAMARLDAGNTELDETVESALPGWHDQSDCLRRGFIARRGDRIVGAAALESNVDDGTTKAEVEFSVLPDEMAAGVGTALLERIEAEARALGRTVLQTWTLHPVDPGRDPLRPATGWGRVARTPLSDVLTTSGFTFEQVERTSALPLDAPLASIEQRLRAARAFAGPDYRVVEWSLPTPSHLRAGYGSIIARMATDVPTGDLVTEAEVWDEEKVTRRDERLLAGGATFSVAAVIHEPTGDMVAFNELMVQGALDGVTHQWGTLVVTEHRGRHLGTLAKCANLLRWRDIAPASPRVVTFNAEENRPMLDINEAIGFVPVMYEGAWKKVLE